MNEHQGRVFSQIFYTKSFKTLAVYYDGCDVAVLNIHVIYGRGKTRLWCSQWSLRGLTKTVIPSY